MKETQQGRRRVCVFAVAFLNVIANAAIAKESPLDAEQVVAAFEADLRRMPQQRNIQRRA